MFKKLLLWLGIASFLWLAWLTTLSTVNAQFNQEWFWGTSDSAIAWVNDTGTLQQGWLISVIKTFINWVLGILSLVALVIVLFGWFKMVTAAGDETKYKDGFKILQQAAVWLAVIWLSWFIVSIIFWLIWNSSWGAVGWAA